VIEHGNATIKGWLVEAGDLDLPELNLKGSLAIPAPPGDDPCSSATEWLSAELAAAGERRADGCCLLWNRGGGLRFVAPGMPAPDMAQAIQRARLSGWLQVGWLPRNFNRLDGVDKIMTCVDSRADVWLFSRSLDIDALNFLLDRMPAAPGPHSRSVHLLVPESMNEPSRSRLLSWARDRTDVLSFTPHEGEDGRLDSESVAGWIESCTSYLLGGAGRPYPEDFSCGKDGAVLTGGAVARSLQCIMPTLTAPRDLVSTSELLSFTPIVLDCGGWSVDQFFNSSDGLDRLTLCLGRGEIGRPPEAAGPPGIASLPDYGWLPPETLGGFMGFPLPDEKFYDAASSLLSHPWRAPMGETAALVGRLLAMASIRHLRGRSESDTIGPHNTIVATGGMMGPDCATVTEILLDGFRPSGLSLLFWDRSHLLPVHGALLLRRGRTGECGMTRRPPYLKYLCPVLSPVSPVPPGDRITCIVRLRGEGLDESIRVDAGQLIRLPLRADRPVAISLHPSPSVDFGFGRGRPLQVELTPGALGLVIDVRGHELRVPTDRLSRLSLMGMWRRALHRGAREGDGQ